MNDINNEFIFRIQDKGNRFVFVDKKTDRLKAEEQIRRSNFVQVPRDPTQAHINIIEQFVEKWSKRKQLSDSWSEFIINKSAQPGKNSTLYKTHKAGTPVRLLTTGCNTAIENLAIFVEKHCQPLAEKIPTRIKDTQHLLKIIDELNSKELPSDAILVSFDIVNMFPSIDNKMGISAVQKALETREDKTPSTQCILEALEICLTHNNSMFDGKHLIQTNGTAMGAANSCSYSDIAIEEIDNIVMQSKDTSFPELLYFGRYRDDCFSIWRGSINRLEEFLLLLNSVSKSIKFTMEIGYDTLCFLDLKIAKNDKVLSTSVYSKPTDSHLYLHGSSCHPKETINAISVGVATRLRRICSSDESFMEKKKEYQAYLAARGHNPKVIKESFNKAHNLSIQQSRLPKKKQSTSSKQITFTTEFNPHGPNIKSILKKHLHLIKESQTLSKIFPDGTISVTFKKLKNLKQLLVRADPYTIKENSTPSNPGYKPCRKKCDSCENFVDHVSVFKCNATGKVFKVRKSLTCTTKNVIYLCYCTNCKKQGVGSTSNWKARLANYKSHIKKSVGSCQIAKHFIHSCKDDSNPTKFLRFVLIDYVDNTTKMSSPDVEAILLEKEKFWIGTLCSIHQGLNDFHDWRRSRRVQKFKINDW